MARAWNKAAWLAFAAALVACSGSGAAGCGSGCGGSALPNDYPHDERVQNAGTVRITRAGLDFLAANGATLAGGALGSQSDAGVATFEIPSSTQTGHSDVPIPVVGGTTPIDYTIHVCPAGPKPTANPPECTAEIDLATAKLKIDALTPNVLRLRGDIPVRLKDLPLKVDTSVGASVDGAVGLGTPQGNGCNPNDKTQPAVDYKTFPVEIALPLVAETHAPRDGYTKIDVDNAQVSLTVAKEDISVCASCGAILDTLGACDFLVGQAKDQAFKSFGGTALGDQIKNQLKTAFCEKPDPQKNPTCPAGTTDQGGVCVFTNAPGVCATTLLGTSGHMDTASLLGGSSAAGGGLDYLFAATGPLDPAPGAAEDDQGYPGHTANGATITLFGGTRAAPASQCVPAFTPTLPANIPVPDELRANTVAPWPANTPGPHLGVALAGRFLDFAFGGLYASGALCLGVTTDQVDQLKTGLLSIVIPSLKNMTFEQKGAAMAITTRPQSPPHVELGTGADLKTDPLLKIKLDKFAIDFYVFSLDRFVRVFTFTADLTIPVNLQTGKDPQKNPNGGILPVLGELGVANGVVTDSPLLLEDPTKIAASLTSVMGGLTSQLGGSISPIDVASALKSQGLALTIPDGGIRRLTKNQDAFLAIFANLEVAPPAPTPGAHARIAERVVDPNGMSLGTLRRETRPILKVELGSGLDGTDQPVEWSYAVDQGTRSPWSTERTPSIQTDDLVFQGRHVLRVWSRRAGDDRTIDAKPAEVPFVIDVLPPTVQAVEARPGEVQVDAFDFVSDASALRARVRRVAGERAEPFGEWTNLSALAAVKTGDATGLDVEVQDEEGNVGRSHVLLIRGRNDPTLGGAAAGCGCEAAGQPGPAKTSSAWALVLGALALALALRRKNAVKRATWAAFGVAGAAATLPACSCGGDVADDALCGSDCKQACGPALPLGMVGAYTSVAKTKSGSLVIAGYADATIDQDGTALYGDLVVGEWDPAKNSVAWQAIDGVPQRTDGTCPTNDRHGFRGGESDPGDDVGLWTSTAIGSGDAPMIAYHDATHRALKFAYKASDGWKTYALFGKPGQDAGRYAKLVVVDDRPVVVFLVLEPGGNAGKLRSRIVVGRANVAVPSDASKWVFQDLNEDDDTPCRPEMCSAAEACVKATKACTPTVNGCAKACATGQACVTQNGAPTCAPVLSEPAIETIPEAVGAYVSIAQGPKGLGVVAYDRIRGNLLAWSPQQGNYTLSILDGEVGSRADGSAKDTGDVGEGAALAIAPDGMWHVAAIDGTREALVHYVVDDGRVLARNVVDDGTGYPDGKHIVGDDATIRVDAAGVTICYQDSTALELRCATGTPDAQGKIGFARSTIAQPGRQGGFFPQLVPGERKVVNHWRALDRAAITYSGDVAVLSF